eukprot:1001073-Ditylum_brightwellii.AAC.1
MCVHLEEAELEKPIRKKIACAEKEHNKDRERKRQDKPKSHHKRRHDLEKRHDSKQKKKFCDYHGLCYHDTDKCDFL